MTVAGIRDVKLEGLASALELAHTDALVHLARYGEETAKPFAVSLFDLAGYTVNRPKLSDFPTVQSALDFMQTLHVTHYGNRGYIDPLASDRYAVPGRGDHLSVYEITLLKAWELLITGATANHELLENEGKEPGFTASYGGRRLKVYTGNGAPWELAITSSGYAPHCDLRVTDGAAANVEYDLRRTRAIRITGIETEMFILGPAHTWFYAPA